MFVRAGKDFAKKIFAEPSLRRTPFHHSPHAPEKKAEENQSACVHAERVTHFVCAARIIRGVNRHVISKKQIRHRDWHQRALHDSSYETRRFGASFQRGLGSIQYPANSEAERDQKCHTAQDRQQRLHPRAFLLCRCVVHRKQRIMLRERATEPEHFDSPARTPEEIAAGYRELARVNRICRLDDPYTRVMSRWLGAESCVQLSILDLGAGDAWLGKQMETFARSQGWEWRVTNLDLNPIPLRLHPGSRNIVGSVLALPFVDTSFDIVIASQMTHHLASDAEVIQHFREAWRVARRGVFISDMKRSAFLYAMLWVMLRVLRLTPVMRADGLLSVRRSWTRQEMSLLVERSVLNGATVTSYFGTRLIIAARKTPA
jgi:ubiquinone/menaquinone biosynthesis C-methylase UbiE